MVCQRDRPSARFIYSNLRLIGGHALFVRYYIYVVHCDLTLTLGRGSERGSRAHAVSCTEIRYVQKSNQS